MSVSLTVIVPTFNRSGYVRRCLTALRACGVPDLQVIVADDGSTDDTREVVAATDPTAVYLWQPNTGTPATARNAGFAHAKGRHVAFLDCDDEWLPARPARTVALLDKYPDVDVLFADARMGSPEHGFVSWIAEAGQREFFEALPHREAESGFRVFERGPFFRRVALRSPLFIGAMVLRREAFEQAGMFDPRLRGAADWDLWLRMAHRFTFAYLDEPLAVYTRHLDNMSSDHDRMIGEFVQALRNCLACDLSPEDRRYVAGRLRQMLYDHAYLAYDAGRVAEARSRFWAALRAGDVRPATAAPWLTCCLPTGVVRRLRGVKRAVGGTG